MRTFNIQEWEKTKYARYVLLLDRQEDKELIKKVEQERKKGLSASQAVKEVMKGK